MQALPRPPPGMPRPPPSLNNPPGPPLNPPSNSGLPSGPPVVRLAPPGPPGAPGPPRGPPVPPPQSNIPGAPPQPSHAGSPPPRPALPLSLLNSIRKPDDPSSAPQVPPARGVPGPPTSTARPPGPPGPPGPPPLMNKPLGPPGPRGPPGPPALGPPPAGPRVPPAVVGPPPLLASPPPRGPPGPPPVHMASPPDPARPPASGPPPAGPLPPRAAPGPPSLPPAKVEGATVNMFDALKEKATKMSESRQSIPAPAAAPVTQRPAASGDSVKGFNTDMLKRAMVLNNEKNDAQKADHAADDDSDNGWSDDDKPTAAPVPAAPFTASTASSSSTGSVLSAGERHPSGVVIKKSMSKPPEVSRPPPSRPLTVTPTITLIDVVNPNVTLSNSSSEGVTSNLASYEGNKVSDLSTAIGPESQPDNAISPAVGLSLEEKDDEDGYISLEGGSDAAVKIQRVRSESKGGDGEKGKKNEGDFDVGKKPENNSAELKMALKLSAQKATRDADIEMQLDKTGMNKMVLLQEEVTNLKKSLARAESRLNEVDKIGGNIKRELEIEKELEDTYRKAYKLKMEKQALEVSVQELQNRLTNVESASVSTASGYAYSHVNSNSIEVAILKGEREKRLENMLQKTKKDKDKAVRFIIDMIGKERISHFLNQHAGEADILDRLMTTFAHLRLDGAQNGNSSPTKHKKNVATPKSKSATKAGLSPAQQSQTNPELKLFAQRSRIDEYYRSTLNKRDL